MSKGSDNVFPQLILEEQGSEPATPAAGTQKLYIDSADQKLKRIDESDVVTDIEGGGIASDLDIGSLPSDTPTSGDLIVFERAGDRYSADVDDLPGGSGAGSFVWIENKTASGSATLDFTSLSDTYNDYMIKIRGLIPASSGENLIIRFANAITPTWDAGNNYRWFYNYRNMAGATGVVADGGATSGIRIAVLVATTAGYSVNADIRLSNLRTAALHKSLNCNLEQLLSSDSNFYGIDTTGLWVNSSNKAFGIRLLMSSGNIASGVVSLYGLKES